MNTRREITDRIAAAIARLYDPREARNIALRTASELSGVPMQALLTDPGAPLEIEGLDAVLAELTAGRPVQYVTGSEEFLGRRFVVREGVLIPRPETEELVSWIVRDERNALTILDVGVGNGCIAVTLALELRGAQLFAADISTDALAVAAENCCLLGADVVIRQADALVDLAQIFLEHFDVVVSNPPYVPACDRAAMHANVRDYEPAGALFVPDDDSICFYRAIAQAGRTMLHPGGRLYFEIYYLAADAICQMLDEEGYTHTVVREDMNGKPRMLCSRLK